jgi:hypothetical protein
MSPYQFGGFQLPDIPGMIRRRIEQIFADINPEETPLAHGIRSHSESVLDMLDGLIHAVAEIEKKLPPEQGKAA